MKPTEPAYKTPREPLLDPKFASSEGWPKAQSSKMSIFEAVLVVGAAKFGEEWTGTELQALRWPVEPKEAHRLSRERSERMVSKAPSPPDRLSRFQDEGRPKVLFGPDAHVWAYREEQLNVLVREEQNAWVQNHVACERLVSTVEWLAQQCRDERLIAYARPSAVGALYPMKAIEWNRENPFDWFVRKGTFNRYFADYQQTWDCYVFFDRTELLNAVATLSHAPTMVQQVDLGSLSPYLRLAVKLALSKGYTSRDAAETQNIREAEVEAAWDEAMPDIPRSNNAIGAIAKVIGFPDATAIRHGQSKKRVQP